MEEPREFNELKEKYKEFQEMRKVSNDTKKTSKESVYANCMLSALGRKMS